MKLTIVAGARPNFMKIAPLIHEVLALQEKGMDISYRLVHTGQHYHPGLSDIFFEELEIPPPHTNLEVGSGSQAVQTAQIMIAFEEELIAHPPDLVIVVGDVNSTMACAIVAKKLQIKVAHVEAGIRSFDLSMPEEINRMVTDSISDYFFTTTEVAGQNLLKTGIEASRIFLVGNVMIDTLHKNLPKLRKPSLFDKYMLQAGQYTVVTLHRPSNVDDSEHLKKLLDAIIEHTRGPVVFPVHPRTQKALKDVTIDEHKVILCDPLGYLEFNYLVKNARVVVTDSGGIQEETTVYGIPCITLRNNTERPETVSIGTNVLVGSDMNLLKENLGNIFANKWKESSIPVYWDGKAARRTLECILGLK